MSPFQATPCATGAAFENLLAAHYRISHRTLAPHHIYTLVAHQFKQDANDQIKRAVKPQSLHRFHCIMTRLTQIFQLTALHVWAVMSLELKMSSLEVGYCNLTSPAVEVLSLELICSGNNDGVCHVGES